MDGGGQMGVGRIALHDSADDSLRIDHISFSTISENIQSL